MAVDAPDVERQILGTPRMFHGKCYQASCTRPSKVFLPES